MPDEKLLAYLYRRHLRRAVIMGSANGLLIAVVWSVLAWFTGARLGFMAIVMGFAVGATVRIVGQGRSVRFGVIGAAITIVCSVAGTLLAGWVLRVEGQPGFFFMWSDAVYWACGGILAYYISRANSAYSKVLDEDLN